MTALPHPSRKKSFNARYTLTRLNEGTRLAVGSTTHKTDKAAAVLLIKAAALLHQESLLKRLAYHSDPSVRVRLAKQAYPSDKADHAYTLARDPDHEVRLQLARSSGKLSGGVQALLATDSVQEVREETAKRSDLIIPVMLALRGDHATVRLNLAENETTPDWILHKLVNDEITEVREALLNNPNTSDDDRIQLALSL